MSTIMTNYLKMRKVDAKLFFEVLINQEKTNRVTIASEIFDRVEIEPDFSGNNITED